MVVLFAGKSLSGTIKVCLYTILYVFYHCTVHIIDFYDFLYFCCNTLGIWCSYAEKLNKERYAKKDLFSHLFYYTSCCQWDHCNTRPFRSYIAFTFATLLGLISAFI
ncbi:hypothetical protein EDEG_01210 [Edhazardia aedis USNM 41457]|uniref:Uncharacterized protein n=1 Tax=Edhazardia aedis (strain USNM 41457) TaxID=1003232 RepID=J8ZY76_EDHAE|nr:hypothetical protein EDEG_01210 [Edhazardia aedis USNM 41457]|eukprot:EJW04583.1 hypothetical protein EDEG_01210 [Edhazardia aedis USNM 41457]